MSASSARNYARRAVSSQDTNDKLDLIAKAIADLVGVIEDMQRKINSLG
jgi:hypothetical protein